MGSKVIEKQFKKLSNFSDKIREKGVGTSINGIDGVVYMVNIKDVFPQRQEKAIKPITFDPNREGIVLVDVDGTIADMDGLRSPFDWDKVNVDHPKTDVIEMVKDLDRARKTICICTGRDGSSADKTKLWLHRHGVPFHMFRIRKADDYRPDWQIKEEIVRELNETYNIDYAIDDRRQVIDHYRRMGITVFDVANHLY